VTAATRLRAEIDAVLADWAYHLDHGELDELVELFTEDALFVSGDLEFRAESKSKIGISNGPWFAPPGTPTVACG
jgi:ketosteroid isomerase-like protein